MSPMPAGNSRAPEPRTITPWLTAALDRIQALGTDPAVNPVRTPWTPPATQPHPFARFLVAFVALTALFLYWFFVADGSGGFIYTGF